MGSVLVLIFSVLKEIATNVYNRLSQNISNSLLLITLQGEDLDITHLKMTNEKWYCYITLNAIN